MQTSSPIKINETGCEVFWCTVVVCVRALGELLWSELNSTEAN